MKINIEEDLIRVIDLLEISIKNLQQESDCDCINKTTFIADRLLQPALEILKKSQGQLTQALDLIISTREIASPLGKE